MEIKFIINQLKDEKPYLKSPLELYEKVLNFNEKSEKILEEEYKKEDLIEKILNEFSSIFEIPYEFVSFLKESLLRTGKDPFKEPDIILELPIGEDKISSDDIKRALFILAKPFFVKFRKNSKVSKRFEDIGRCPVCEKPISLTMIDIDNKRHMVCTFCGYREEIFRIGCSYCMQKICEKIDLLVDEDEIRVELCKDCKTYIKSFKNEVYQKYKDPYLIDIISLPLDVVAQERGYIRRSPNAIGVEIIK